MSDQEPVSHSKPSPDTLFLDKKTLRRQLRARRRALSRQSQQAAAQRAMSVIAKRPEFVSADHVAGYLAADGEIDPTPVLALAQAAGKRIYLPVLLSGNRLRFAAYAPGDRLKRNRLGLYEPVVKRYRAAARLDLVLMPLVGFDRNGGRLGMGGGFYDRSFAFLSESKKRRPRLVGLAHAFQQVDNLPLQAWDLPMAAVATDRGWVTTRRF